MAAIAKGTANVPSLITTLPAPNHMIGPFGDVPGTRQGGAGENIKAGDVCYVNSAGEVMRALEDQTGVSAAINDVQTMYSTLSAANVGNISGGNYIVGYKGQYTAVIAYNAVAATVQTAVQALSTVGAGNLLVTGSFPNFVFTAASGLAGQALELIEVQSSLIDIVDPMPVVLGMIHTTVGQPVGASGAEQAQSRVRGIAPMNVLRGHPITLYDACIFTYSDGLLTPGADVFLSGTVPGGLDTARTLATAVQKPVGFAMDTNRIYFFSIA